MRRSIPRSSFPPLLALMALGTHSACNLIASFDPKDQRDADGDAASDGDGDGDSDVDGDSDGDSDGDGGEGSDGDEDVDTDVDTDGDGDIESDADVEIDATIDADTDPDDDPDICGSEEIHSTCSSSSCVNCADEDCDGVTATDTDGNTNLMMVDPPRPVVGEPACVRACSNRGYVCIKLECYRPSGALDGVVDSACPSSCEDCAGINHAWCMSYVFSEPGLWTCVWRRGNQSTTDCSLPSEGDGYACGVIEVVER